MCLEQTWYWPFKWDGWNEMIKGKLRSVDDFQSIFSGKHQWANPDWFHLRSIILHQLVSHAPPAGGRKWSPGQSYLDTEVSSVHVVSEEQIAGVAGWAAHLEKLHQVKELAVDVPTHWRHTHTHSWVQLLQTFRKLGIGSQLKTRGI